MFYKFFIIGLLIYFLGLIISFVFTKNKLTQYKLEIIISSLLFSCLFAMAVQIPELIDNSIGSMFVIIPIVVILLKSYDYVIQPLVFVCFRRNKITEKYNYIVAESGIKAKIVVIENLDNAFATGILQFTNTIIIGRKLIDNMTPKQLEGVIFHEIAHLKNKHLYFLLLIDIVSFCLFAILSYFLYNHYPNSLIIRVCSFGILGGLLPLLGVAMKPFELKADKYAASRVGKQEYINTLYRLNEISNNKMNKFSLTHPTIYARVKSIKKN